MKFALTALLLAFVGAEDISFEPPEDLNLPDYDKLLNIKKQDNMDENDVASYKFLNGFIEEAKQLSGEDKYQNLTLEPYKEEFGGMAEFLYDPVQSIL